MTFCFKDLTLHISVWSGVTFSEVAPIWQGYVTAAGLPIRKQLPPTLSRFIWFSKSLSSNLQMAQVSPLRRSACITHYLKVQGVIT